MVLVFYKPFNILRTINPTATLLEHTLLTPGFMSTSKAVSLVAGDRKIADSPGFSGKIASH